MLSISLLCALVAAAPPDPGSILSDAAERIHTHRTGDLIISVVDAASKPITGARVTVAQERHDFLFGCNLFALGSFRDPRQEAAYRTRYKEIFNFATLPFYWSNFERRQGEPGYAKIDTMVAWCKEQGITTKGHPLVWNHPAGVPDWLPDDPAAVRQLLSQRVEACVRRFRGAIDIWDVVNEAADPYRFQERHQITHLMQTIGVRPYLLDAFHAARTGNPNARFLINDYRMGDDYENVVKMLTEKGSRLYQIIGIQSHMHGGVWSPEHTWRVCERFSAFGVPLHFTETTLVSGPRRPGTERWAPTEPALEERQARQAVTFYTVLFSHPAVTALTWWDFADAHAWQDAAAGFLRKDCSPKPMYTALRTLIRGAWWTTAQAPTDKDGRVSIAAFFGVHRITVTPPTGSAVSRTITFPRPWPPPTSQRAVKRLTMSCE